MNAAELASRLDAKRVGDGWMACCPAHEDRSPSLSISEGDDGRILLHDHAGCSTAAVLTVLGLTERDLFNGNGNGHRASALGQEVAAYDYRDEDGALLYQVVRYAPKGFRQRKPDGNGGWVWKLDAVRRVPYRLPELLQRSEDAPVWVVEGEKDANALAERGLAATTNAGGAGKWRDEYDPAFRDADVIIVPDNDDPGRAHAADVARHLHTTAARVRIITLPRGKDSAEFLAGGGTVADLTALATAATDWTPAAPAADAQAGEASAPSSSPRLRGFSDLEILQQPDPEFVVAGLVPKGGLVEVVGRWGAGKTFLLLDWGMHIGAGMEWQGRRTERGPVLYVYAEGAMRTRVAAWRAAHRIGPEETVGVTFIPGTLNLLDAGTVAAFAADVAAGAYGPPPFAMIVLETLSRMTPGGDENSPETAGLVVAGCEQLQHRTGAAVVLSHHTPWNPDQQRPRGHTKLPDAADAVYVLDNKSGLLTLSCLKMRDGEAPAPTHLKLTPQDGALVIDAGTAPAARRDEIDERILEVAIGIPGLSTNSLIGSVGGNRLELLDRVHTLVARGVLVNTGTEKRPKWRHNPPTVPTVPNGSSDSRTVVPLSVPALPSLGERNREPIHGLEACSHHDQEAAT